MNIVIEYITVEDTPLYTLVGARVARRKTPSGFENTVKQIVVIPTSNGSQPNAPVQSGIYSFRCYGGSSNSADAEAVSDALYDRLHGASGTTTTGGIVTSWWAGSTLTEDPNTGWPVWLAQFQIETT